jgi:hypothetical protein
VTDVFAKNTVLSSEAAANIAPCAEFRVFGHRIICEYAQVWFNGALLESACSESENYPGMRKAIVALGIDSMPNINYLKAAKRVVGMA